MHYIFSLTPVESYDSGVRLLTSGQIRDVEEQAGAPEDTATTNFSYTWIHLQMWKSTTRGIAHHEEESGRDKLELIRLEQ